MTEYKVFIANGVFPRFSSTPLRYRDWNRRAKDIAKVVQDSGADCATFNELGRPECAVLAEHLSDWQYDRAQGTGIGVNREGLNSSWSWMKVWDRDNSQLHDYDMPSNGQWIRTFIIARLIDKSNPAAWFGLGAFHETLGNAPGLAYVKAMIRNVGNKRVLLGGDFKRTEDTDDLADMAAAGLKVHGRTAETPMVCFTKNAVTVTRIDLHDNPSCFDHKYRVAFFTLPERTP